MTAPSARTPTYVWYVVGLLWLVNIFNYVDRTALSVLLPAIKADLELSDGQLGLLVGLAFSIFYGLCGLPIARLADRVSRKKVIAGALALWSVMTALSGAAMNFWHLFLARIGIGVGEAGCIPPSQSLLCDLFPPERRGGVLAFHSFGISVGMMGGITLAGILGDAIGWRWTFIAFGAPGVVLALIVWLTVREPRRGAMDTEVTVEIRPPPVRESIAILMRSRTFVWILIFLTSNGFVQYGLNQWWPSLFTRVFNISASQMGLPLGSAVAIGSAIGVLLGASTDRLASRDLRLPLVAAAAATGLSVLPALGTLFAPSFPLAVLAVGASILLWSVCTAPAYAALYNSTPPEVRTVAGALPILCTAIIGFGFGPLTVGLLSDALAPSFGDDALRYAALAPVCVIPLLVLALWKASRGLPAKV